MMASHDEHDLAHNQPIARRKRAEFILVILVILGFLVIFGFFGYRRVTRQTMGDGIFQKRIFYILTEEMIPEGIIP